MRQAISVVALILLIWTPGTPCAAPDLIQQHGALMLRAIADGNLKRVQALLQTPYVEPEGFQSGQRWVSFLKAALDSDNIEVIEFFSRLPHDFGGDSKCDDAIIWSNGTRDQSVYAILVSAKKFSPAGVMCDTSLKRGWAPTPFAHYTISTFHGRSNERPILEWLLRNGGAPKNRQALGGETALHIAAYYGDTVAITLLLAAGEAVDIRNERGFTPIEMIGRFGNPASDPKNGCHAVPVSPDQAQVSDMLIKAGSPAPRPINRNDWCELYSGASGFHR